MQIPTEWIKEFCGFDATNDQMANQLTMAGVECEFLDLSKKEIIESLVKENLRQYLSFIATNFLILDC